MWGVGMLQTVFMTAVLCQAERQQPLLVLLQGDEITPSITTPVIEILHSKFIGRIRFETAGTMGLFQPWTAIS